MLISNLAVAAFLLLALIGSHVSPQLFTFPAYFTLAYWFVIIINVGYVLFWMLARKWTFLISLSLLLFSATQIKDTFPVHLGKTKERVAAHPVTILTYNTMMSGKLVKYDSPKSNKVMQYILDSDADIVCLQEFTTSKKKQYLTQEDIMQIFKKYPYKHIDYKVHIKSKQLGIATFSKFPIVNKQRIDYPSVANLSIYSDINIHGQIIRLVNNHLESNRITEKDKDMPGKLKENFDAENLTSLTLHFSKKLEVAYKSRAFQAEAVAKTIAQSPYKVIVCGDFNDVPSSYAYTTVKGKLSDVYSEIGTGLGNTFNERFYGFRIDYVFYDPTVFIPIWYKMDKVNYSDHYPVMCQLDMKLHEEES